MSCRALTFNADATYTCSLMPKPRKSKSDLVIANGVTINSGASFNFQAIVKGKLRKGTLFNLLSKTSAAPINGAFATLPDGAILTVNGDNFQPTMKAATGTI